MKNLVVLVFIMIKLSSKFHKKYLNNVTKTPRSDPTIYFSPRHKFRAKIRVRRGASIFYNTNTIIINLHFVLNLIFDYVLNNKNPY